MGHGHQPAGGPASPDESALRRARRALSPARRRATGVARTAVRGVDRARRGGAVGRLGDDRDLRAQWRWSACYAPATTLYLDQHGVARACCQNTDHPLGDVRTSTLRDIWRGEAATRLRRQLARGDLGLGCDFCAWQVDETGRSDFARGYDPLPSGPRGVAAWPARLELAISNTCNLQCVMCNGDWSSAIRTRREGREPLPTAYPERFYEELEEVVPHLRTLSFTGGEPFLGREPLRVMEVAARVGGPSLTVAVVTNGTVLTPRVEALLDRVRPWITVSIDGATAEVYERIRVGASFSTVMANLDRFRAIVEDHGAGLSLTHCLMVDNWRTFPEMLRLAEDRGLALDVNAVRFPARHSLYQLPAEDLAEVVAGLEARSAEVATYLTGERLATWHAQLHALRARAGASRWPAALGVPPATEVVLRRR